MFLSKLEYPRTRMEISPLSRIGAIGETKLYYARFNIAVFSMPEFKFKANIRECIVTTAMLVDYFFLVMTARG